MSTHIDIMNGGDGYKDYLWIHGMEVQGKYLGVYVYPRGAVEVTFGHEIIFEFDPIGQWLAMEDFCGYPDEGRGDADYERNLECESY